jgi:hypothetical protein
MKKSSLGSIAAAGVSFALVVGCAGGVGDTNSPLRAPFTASHTLTQATAAGQDGDGVVNQGEVEVCKRGAAGQIAVVVDGAAAVPYSLAKDQCKVVAVNLSQTVNSNVTVSEVSSPSYSLVGIERTDLAFVVGTPDVAVPETTSPDDPVAVILNGVHGTLLVYTNRAVGSPPPPPPICDFITFGRLKSSANGKKIVISGNIGGNQPKSGILSEFHVEWNGVDYHVANVDTYGAITSGPLSGLTNSRISTGTAKNGVAVEVRMWDGGEPGKNTDVVYVKIGGVEVLGANGQKLDQGNMQYHSNCRGPG